jgi:hypothetical protein
VTEYVDQFSILIDQLVAYEAEANPLYYATRFVDGLKEEIRAIVMIQRPSTLDTACALALVQEKVMDLGKKKESRLFSRTTSRSSYHWLGPPKYDKPLHQQPSEEKQLGEVPKTDSTDEKLKALKQYRRARGLCDRCAENWVYDHKCAPTIQLHVMQELWELLSEDESPPDSAAMIECAKEQGSLCVFLSEAVV